MRRFADFDVDDSVIDPYSRCGRINPIYTFFKAVSAAFQFSE